MGVTILNQQERRVAHSMLRRVAKCVLERFGEPNASLSIVLVDDETIARYNETYLSHRGPTDVISFPQREGDLPSPRKELLGDVMVSVERAAEQAEQYGHGIEEEVVLLVIHGLHHLLGWDDQTPRERAEMEREQQRLLQECYRQGQNPHQGEQVR